jgi:hypothetical protein
MKNQRMYHVDFIDSTNGEVLDYDDVQADNLADAKQEAQKMKRNALKRIMSSDRYPHINSHKLRTSVTIRRH